MSIERYAVIETALCIGGNIHDGEVFMVRAIDHDHVVKDLSNKLSDALNQNGHRQLLVKFMQHVAQCEGITFLNKESDIEFRDDEYYELYRLSEEGDKLYPINYHEKGETE